MVTSLGFLDSRGDLSFGGLPLLAVHLELGLPAEAVGPSGGAGGASGAASLPG